jgi:glycosyltransferase involved in cell wall biosynthesis
LVLNNRAGHLMQARVPPRGVLHLPITVIVYLSFCLFATLFLYETGSSDLFWPAHIAFAVVVVASLLHRSAIGALLARLFRAGPVFLALMAFLAYFLLRCIFTPYEELGSYYAKIGVTHLGLGTVLGFCVIYPLVALSRWPHVARAGLIVYVVALALITAFLGPRMRQDIFLIDLKPQNASYYQIFGDYLVMSFACCMVFMHAAGLGRGMSAAGFVSRQALSALLAVWSVLVAQAAGSNNAGVTITLMSVLYYLFDSVFTLRACRVAMRARLFASSLGLATLIAVAVALLILALPPLRIFNFEPVGLPIMLLERPNHEVAFEIPTSVVARVETLDFFWQQFSIDPIWGHLGADWVIGRPGFFPHTLLSVQSHLGAVGSILLLLFIWLAVTHPNSRQLSNPISAIVATILIIGFAATFFTWMPIWFLAGALTGLAGLKSAKGPSGTHLHVSMTAFLNESRVLKETKSLLQGGVAQRIVILALHEDDLPLREDLDERRVLHRVALRSRNLPTNLLMQVLKYVEFAWVIFREARREGIDVISVHTVALLPIGVLVKEGLGAQLVYDAHELETEANGRSGVRQTLARMVERLLIPAVDLTIVVSPGIEGWYRKTYGLQTITTVLNAPDRVEKVQSNKVRDALGIDADRTVLLYQGALVSGRGVDHLLAAAPVLAQRGYDLVLMGYGPMQDEIVNVSVGHRNVHFLPAVAPAEVMAYTMSADIGLCSIEDSCLSYRLSLPNKLFEYLFAGLPVIVSNLPEMAHIVQTHRVGAVVDRWRADDILVALQSVEALRDDALGGRLNEIAACYDWSRQKDRMIEAYRAVLHAPKAHLPSLGSALPALSPCLHICDRR